MPLLLGLKQILAKHCFIQFVKHIFNLNTSRDGITHKKIRLETLFTGILLTKFKFYQRVVYSNTAFHC